MLIIYTTLISSPIVTFSHCRSSMPTRESMPRAVSPNPVLISSSVGFMSSVITFRPISSASSSAASDVVSNDGFSLALDKNDLGPSFDAPPAALSRIDNLEQEVPTGSYKILPP